MLSLVEGTKFAKNFMENQIQTAEMEKPEGDFEFRDTPV